jgi:hypothetical protein
MGIKLIAAILLLAPGLTFCQRETDNFKSRGTITGPDVRDCACCGGWYIKIDTSQYEFDTLPAGTNVDLQKDIFPIHVKLDWQLSAQLPCPDKRIIITRIIKEWL